MFRIVVVGDSFVFGSGGVEAAYRFTDILERTTKNTEVINMGVPAYGSDQEYLYLKTEGMKYHPDLVILCAFENDFVESFSTVNPSNGRPKGYFSTVAGQLVFHPPSFSAFYKLSQRSYVLGLTDLLLGELAAYRQAYWKAHTFNVLEPQERVATFKQIFISAGNLCKERGAEFLLVYFPFRGQKGENIIQQVMDGLAATEGYKTLDLTDYMRGVDVPERPAYFKKEIHFNENGHQAVAKILREYLATTGLLPSSFLGNPAIGPAMALGH